MKKISLSIDYNNICKDYNTVYLDRDNSDKETVNCMNSVMQWLENLLSELLQTFGYKIFKLGSRTPSEIKEIASRRFLFYSLEKEITLQAFILQQDESAHNNLASWLASDDASIIIQNDNEGEGIYFYTTKDSKFHHWLCEKLDNFSIDEIPFEAK